MSTTAFKKRKSTDFLRQVTVLLPDDSQGVLSVTYRQLPIAEVDKLIMNGGDLALCKASVVRVGDIPIEGADPAEMLTGEDALQEVLGDGCCVGAMAREYIEVTRGRNFRGGRPQVGG